MKLDKEIRMIKSFGMIVGTIIIGVGYIFSEPSIGAVGLGVLAIGVMVHCISLIVRYVQRDKNDAYHALDEKESGK